jgi:uncharacterized protein (TIGR04255 family)
MNTTKFHFPPEIKLENNPLMEAWLEIRWQLEPTEVPRFKRDPTFAFALGVFYESVKDSFGYKEPLNASRAPDDILPHVVRYRFRPAEASWPLLQLGPGVATINFTDPYTWDSFKEKALYLRNKLLNAYGEVKLKAQVMALRYRNGVPFEPSSNDLFAFSARNLNTSIALSDHIPGPVSSTPWPTGANINLTFDLSKPKGIGTLQFATAVRQQDLETDLEKPDEMLMWQLEVVSKGTDAPEINEEQEFAHWLDLAHAVIHEWFFALIDGPLRKSYEGEGE